MQREFSAGAVLVRRLGGKWVFAAIRPAGKPAGTLGAAEGTGSTPASGRRRRRSAR